jgi:predicted transcriptional regulator
MEIHLSSEQEAQLFQIAEHEGKKPEQLIFDLALGLIEDDSNIRAILRDRVAEADRGIFIEDEEMDARFKAMMNS